MSEFDLIEATTDTSIGDVVVASSLSNLLVVKCLHLGVRIILTQECNLASHAANILRAANSMEKTIEWISGVDVEQLSPFIGKQVFFNDKAIWIDGSSLVISLDTKHKKLELINKSKASLNLNTKMLSFWYYPETYFTKFAFSLMKESLELELKRFFCCQTDIILSNGLLEFRNAPALVKINEYAMNVFLAEQYYFEMFENYNQIVESLRQNSWDYQTLCINAQKYYSTFLVLHRSYNGIFQNMILRLREELGNDSDCICNEILQSKINVWLSNQDNVLINRKKFLQDEPIAKIPEFTVIDDLEDSIQRVKKSFDAIRKRDYYESNQRWLKLHSLIFVLKEWKFVIYKIIFTHIKVILENKGIFNCISKEEISNMAHYEVGELL